MKASRSRLWITAGKAYISDRMFAFEHRDRELIFSAKKPYWQPEEWELTIWRWYICVYRAAKEGS